MANSPGILVAFGAASVIRSSLYGENEMGKWIADPVAHYTGLGAALGAAFGAALDDIGVGVGVALGVAIGAGIGASLKKKRETRDRNK